MPPALAKSPQAGVERTLRQRANWLRAFLTPRGDPGSAAFPATAGERDRMLAFPVEIPVRSYLNQALPLSVVSVGGDHWECLYSSFVQLFFPINKLPFDRVLMLPGLSLAGWERAGFVAARQVDPHDGRWREPARFVEFLVRNLDEGRYVEIHADEYYFPGRPCHGKVHSVHDNMIVGYRAGGRRFVVAGYGSDYGTSEVKCENLLAAFHQMPRRQLHRRRLQLIERTPAVRAPFDAKAVQRQLGEYLSGSSSVSPEEMMRVRPYPQARRFEGAWGLDTYAAFRSYFLRVGDQKEDLDLRATRTLWEHKVLMLGRLRHMERIGLLEERHLLSSAYAEVEQLARTLRFAAFEYSAAGRTTAQVKALIATGEKLEIMEAPILRRAFALMNIKEKNHE